MWKKQCSGNPTGLHRFITGSVQNEPAAYGTGMKQMSYSLCEYCGLSRKVAVEEEATGVTINFPMVPPHS